MNIPLVDLKAGFMPLKEEIMQAISDVLKGMNLHIGPNVKALEEEFAAFIGVKHAIGVASGTDAILIALLSAGIKQGDEVITSPHTFFATIEAIYHAGARPVFVDIDEQDYNINPREIQQKITPKTRAIIPVHMYGQSADMEPILEIARKYNLKVIEDACQSHGAEYLSQKTGSIGDAGCFSFYYTKNLGAYGEGGMITTNNDDINEYARYLRNHGHKSKFEHVAMGYNSRLDEMQSAILRIRLRHLNKYNQSRQDIAQKYNSLLKDLPIITPKEMEGRKHVYHLYVIRTEQRDELQDYLLRHGIGTGIHYKNPTHLQEASAIWGYKRGDMPATERVCNEILSLPIYPELTDEQIEFVGKKIRGFFNQQ